MSLKKLTIGIVRKNGTTNIENCCNDVAMIIIELIENGNNPRMLGMTVAFSSSALFMINSVGMINSIARIIVII